MGKPEDPPPQQTSMGAAEGKINQPQQTSSERPIGPPPPPPEPTQAELHQKYDVTKQDAANHVTNSRQYERYAVAAEAWRANYEAHPTNPRAREMAAKADEMASKYFKDNVEPLDKKILKPDGQPNPYTTYEPGADAAGAQRWAKRAEANHNPNMHPSAKHPEYGSNKNDHVLVNTGEPGDTYKYDMKAVGECQAEMNRALAREKATHAVEANAQNRPAQGHGHGHR